MITYRYSIMIVEIGLYFRYSLFVHNIIVIMKKIISKQTKLSTIMGQPIKAEADISKLLKYTQTIFYIFQMPLNGQNHSLINL